MHWEKKCIAPAMNKKRTKKKLHQNLITVIPALHNSLNGLRIEIEFLLFSFFRLVSV